MKVKIFDESHEKDLEEEINKFIKEKDNLLLFFFNFIPRKLKNREQICKNYIYKFSIFKFYKLTI